MKFGKLEALKFKMKIQTKNLQMLSDHSDLINNIYADDRNKGTKAAIRTSSIAET